MRRISRNLTAETIGDCKCDYCRQTTGKVLKYFVPVVLTAGLWLVWRAYDERRAAKENGK